MSAQGDQEAKPRPIDHIDARDYLAVILRNSVQPTGSQQCVRRTRTEKETKSSSLTVRQNIAGLKTQLVNCFTNS